MKYVSRTTTASLWRSAFWACSLAVGLLLNTPFAAAGLVTTADFYGEFFVPNRTQTFDAAGLPVNAGDVNSDIDTGTLVFDRVLLQADVDINNTVDFDQGLQGVGNHNGVAITQIFQTFTNDTGSVADLVLNFDVLPGGVNLSGPAQVGSFSAEVEYLITVDGVDAFGGTAASTSGSGVSADGDLTFLNGFNQTDSGASWASTRIALDLGTFGVGESVDVNYFLRTEVVSTSTCVSGDPALCTNTDAEFDDPCFGGNCNWTVLSGDLPGSDRLFYVPGFDIGKVSAGTDIYVDVPGGGGPVLVDPVPPQPVPEPGPLTLIVLGLLALTTRRRVASELAARSAA